MKRFGKFTLAALMLGGVAVAAATPAAARVSVGIGIGVPGYYGEYDSPCADPEFRYWHPRECGYPAYYAEPYFYGGYYGGHYRYHGGHDWHGGGHNWHGGDHHGGHHH